MADKKITDEDLSLLDELGVEANAPQTGERSAREQRIIAGFDEIMRFVEEHGRSPEHGEKRNIFERLYAVRLDEIRSSTECCELLRGYDSQNLLRMSDDFGSSVLREETVEYRGSSEPSDEELLAQLGVTTTTADEDIFYLKHVRSSEEIRAAEEVAQRNPCNDFDVFRPIFEVVQHDIETGKRQTLKYKDNAEVKNGDLFILDGQKVIVADMGDPFVSDYGRPDRRLRVIYDNGTESDLLVRSLQRALNKDKASRRITEPNLGPLFSDEEAEGDLPSGLIYVLRSFSSHPFIAENRSVIHKIGVTGGDVGKRIANAKKDPTYLLADVEVMGFYKLVNINRTLLEAMIHKFFASARLDLELKDRFGGQVEPREWFLVPLPVIEEAIQKLRDGSIGNFRYDPATAQIMER